MSPSAVDDDAGRHEARVTMAISPRRWGMVALIAASACGTSAPAGPAPTTAPGMPVPTATALPSPTTPATAREALSAAAASLASDRSVKVSRVATGVGETVDSAGKVNVIPIQFATREEWATPDRSHVIARTAQGETSIIRVGTSWWTLQPNASAWTRSDQTAIAAVLDTLLVGDYSASSSPKVEGPVACGAVSCWKVSAKWARSQKPPSTLAGTLLIEVLTNRLTTEVVTEQYEDGHKSEYSATFYDHAKPVVIEPPQ